MLKFYQAIQGLSYFCRGLPWSRQIQQGSGQIYRPGHGEGLHLVFGQGHRRTGHHFRPFLRRTAHGLAGGNSPEKVLGIVLEDPPFFATEPDRCDQTFAGLGFELIHQFLNQTEETNYTRFYLENTYLQTFFGEGWQGIKNYAFKYMERNPGKPLRIFFLPPSINKAFT